MVGRLRRRVATHAFFADERGFTLTELVTVLVILLTILGALTTLFVSGTFAQADMTKRFDAQQNARLALDKIRRETHCANAISGTSTGVTLTLPTGCPSGTGQITWCTRSTGTGRYGLYRKAGTDTACTTPTATNRVVDYLTTGAVFTMGASSTSGLATLKVNLPVDADPANSTGTYTLCDVVALRNTSRTGAASAPPTC